MRERILAAIGKTRGVEDWRLTETDRECLERYYVGKSLDLARGSRTRDYSVCLLSDAEGAEGKRRGSSVCAIRSGMSDAEISAALEFCAYAASKSRGPWYPLPEANADSSALPLPPLSSGSMEEWAGLFAEALYAEDRSADPRINSLELFIRRARIRVLNSRGLDERFERATADYEYIVQARGPSEEVELFRESGMARFDEAALRAEVAGQLSLARDRAGAKPIASLGADFRGLPVILSGDEAISGFFGYYLARTDAQAVYDGASDASPGYRFRPAGAGGDAPSLRMAAYDEGLAASSPVDGDGLRLAELPLIEEGKVLSLHGQAKYFHLLGLAPRGAHPAARVGGGRSSAAELRSGRRVECVSFSDFSMDGTTGDFGGEIRLGYYSDGGGGEPIPFSGGAISGNVADNAAELRFSRETAAAGALRAPICLRLASASIAGS